MDQLTNSSSTISSDKLAKSKPAPGDDEMLAEEGFMKPPLTLLHCVSFYLPRYFLFGIIEEASSIFMPTVILAEEFVCFILV